MEKDENLIWFKSSLSTADCVEAAHLPGGGMALRNSRDHGEGVVRFTPGEWEAFLGGIDLGEFDRPRQ